MSKDATQKMGRTQRQHVITRLLASHRVTNQEQLVDLLAAEGVAFGAIKVRAGDGDSTYAIPDQPHAHKAPDEHLRRIFGDWVVEVNMTHNIVVLRTPPGSAHVVGSALDRADLPEVAGTVAGDDTLFVVVTDPDHPVTGPTAALAQRLRDLAGLNQRD
jgi:transcriptional regulator of arginine metabolism